MIRTKTETLALKCALERGEHYGFSTFSEGWFVGTREQLAAIGVVLPVPAHRCDDGCKGSHSPACNARWAARTGN